MRWKKVYVKRRAEVEVWMLRKSSTGNLNSLSYKDCLPRAVQVLLNLQNVSCVVFCNMLQLWGGIWSLLLPYMQTSDWQRWSPLSLCEVWDLQVRFINGQEYTIVNLHYLSSPLWHFQHHHSNFLDYYVYETLFQQGLNKTRHFNVRFDYYSIPIWIQSLDAVHGDFHLRLIFTPPCLGYTALSGSEIFNRQEIMDFVHQWLLKRFIINEFQPNNSTLFSPHLHKLPQKWLSWKITLTKKALYWSYFRINGHRSYHCNICGVCLDKKLLGNHSCREGSAHDPCVLCSQVSYQAWRFFLTSYCSQCLKWITNSKIARDRLTT